MKTISKIALAIALIIHISQAKIHFPKDIEPCPRFGDGDDECVLIDHCPKAILHLDVANVSKPCAFQGLKPFVCCRKSDIKIPGTISKQKCDEVFKPLPFDENGIVDGTTRGKLKPTLTENYPHVAALGCQKENSISWNCAGGLISNKFVITTAHCLINNEINIVRLGDLDLNGTYEVVQTQTYKVHRKIIHPAYSPPAIYDDIALIELDQQVEFTEFVKPACLQITEVIDEAFFLANGFESKNSSGYLYALAVIEPSKVTCDFYFNTMDRFKELLPNGIDYETQICAGGIFVNDPCQFDTGGPLVYYNLNYTEGRFAIGVTVLPKPCSTNNAPGLYTRISHYLPWIESLVWPED